MVEELKKELSREQGLLTMSFKNLIFSEMTSPTIELASDVSNDKLVVGKYKK